MTASSPASVLQRRSLTGWDVGAVLSSLLQAWCEQEQLQMVAVYGAAEADQAAEPTSALGRPEPFRSGLPLAVVHGVVTRPDASSNDAEEGAIQDPVLEVPPVEVPPVEVIERELPGGYRLAYSGPGASRCAPSEDRLLGFALAAKIAELSGKLKRGSFQESYQAVTLEAVYDVGLAIASMLDLEQLSEEILLRAVSLLDARRGALYRLSGTEYRLEKAIGGGAAPILAAAIAEGLMKAAAEAENVLPGAQHLLAVPIAVDGAARGMLVVGDKESRLGVGPFAVGDGRALALFANQAAIALENARLHRQALDRQRLEREMELAAEIQRGLLPKKNPCLEGYEIVGWNRPTRHVGGDYYGFLELGAGKLGAVVADVTGKGMPAALLVSTLQSALRLLADRGLESTELMAALNQHIAESSASNKFITLLLLELDWANHQFHYVNAGHNPGLLIRFDGSVELLEASGMPLGMLPGTRYRRGTASPVAGDLVCLYSDGITECESPAGEEYGQDRLTHFLVTHRGCPLDELLAAIDREVTEFAGGKPQGDDQTVLLVRALERSQQNDMDPRVPAGVCPA